MEIARAALCPGRAALRTTYSSNRNLYRRVGFLEHMRSFAILSLQARTIVIGVMFVFVLGPSGASAAFPGTNGLIAFSGTSPVDPEPYVMVERADGSRVRVLARGAAPAVSPIDALVAFAAPDLFDVDIDSRRLAVISPSAIFGATQARPVTGAARPPETDPSFSPNGRSVVYVRGESSSLSVATFGRTRPRKLKRHRASAPEYSGDGSQIAFSQGSRRPGTSRRSIVVVDANGKQRQVLTSGFSDEHPSWSPDNRQIVFRRSCTKQRCRAGIYVMGSGGSHPRRVVANSEAVDPVWSPDGRLIAYVSKGRIIIRHPRRGSKRRLYAAHVNLIQSDPYWASCRGRCRSRAPADYPPARP